MTRRPAGFTLIELLTVLAILGILTAMAYPSYARHIARTRRIEAQLVLMEAVQRQEQYRAQHHSYIAFSHGASDPDTHQFRTWSGHGAAASAYEIDGQACPGHDIVGCIVLRARPGTANVNAAFTDPDCGTLTLDSTGAHTASGPAPRCWP